MEDVSLNAQVECRSSPTVKNAESYTEIIDFPPFSFNWSQLIIQVSFWFYHYIVPRLPHHNDKKNSLLSHRETIPLKYVFNRHEKSFKYFPIKRENPKWRGSGGGGIVLISETRDSNTNHVLFLNYLFRLPNVSSISKVIKGFFEKRKKNWAGILLIK